MDLNTLWFVLVAVLFVGFFFLEGFDFGVETLLPFLSKDEKLRQKLGTNAAETIKKEHTWEHYGEQTRKLYSDLLSMKK